MTASEIIAILRKRYASPEWAFFPEIPDGTGSTKSRTADAIAVNCWPSRGLEVHGFEVKRSRPDWLREMKNPEKADAFIPFCDRWWLVLDDDSHVLPGELPPNWGILSVKGGKVRVKMDAPKLSPQPMSRTFITSLLRRAAEANDPSQEIRAAYNKGYQEGTTHAPPDLQHYEHKITALEEMIRKFEEASGVRLLTWGDSRKIGEAVRKVMLQTNDVEAVMWRLGNLERQVKEFVTQLGRIKADFEKKE